MTENSPWQYIMTKKEKGMGKKTEQAEEWFYDITKGIRGKKNLWRRWTGKVRKDISILIYFLNF